MAGIVGNDIVHSGALRIIAHNAVQARDFDSLNEVERYLRTTRSRLPGGQWELPVFIGGIRRDLEGLQDTSSPCVLKGMDFVRDWVAHDPRQAGPYIVEAELLLDHGWCFRGTGYASEVAPEAWRQFHDNLDAAYRVLAQHANVAKADPHYYYVMEKVYLGQGRSASEFQHLLDEASAREPYYYDIYEQAAQRAQPQWGGSVEEVDRIARYAMERTKQQDGAGAYARVYLSIDCGCGITQYRIDHALLAKAMDDVTARTPSDWNAAQFAQLACHFGDAALTAKEFARGGRDDGIEWDDSSERPKCREFAGLPAAG